MKKFFFLLVFALMALTANAQKFGVRVGFNGSNIKADKSYEAFGIDMKMKPGFNVGLMAELPFSEMLSFETGILVDSKGFRLNESNSDGGISYTYKGNMNLYYVDVPLTAKGNFEVSDYKVHAVFGPYVGFGVLGNSKTKMTANGESETTSTKVKWGTDAENDDLRRLDYGLTLGAGAEIKGIEMRLNYSLGLANVASDHTTNGKFNNSLFSVSACYFLGDK